MWRGMKLGWGGVEWCTEVRKTGGPRPLFLGNLLAGCATDALSCNTKKHNPPCTDATYLRLPDAGVKLQKMTIKPSLWAFPDWPPLESKAGAKYAFGSDLAMPFLYSLHEPTGGKLQIFSFSSNEAFPQIFQNFICRCFIFHRASLCKEGICFASFCFQKAESMMKIPYLGNILSH